MNEIGITTQRDVANYILKVSKPINIKIIERFGKFRIHIRVCSRWQCSLLLFDGNFPVVQSGKSTLG